MGPEITIGVVAGLIALGVFIVQVWCPTILTYVLAAHLREKETAVTWSVAARCLLRSYWPTILQSETASSSGVRTGVYIGSLFYPTIAFLVTVAGIVTPLGLYDAVELGGKPEAVAFKPAVDLGPFGLATGPRLNHTFTRICGWEIYRPCPNSRNYGVEEGDGRLEGNATYPWGLSTRVPEELIEVFSSGTKGVRTTVSNFFDIEWRQLTWRRDVRKKVLFDNGTLYSVGQFRQVDSSILEDQYKVVEGLVVDARHGGVGFRNHTIPSNLPRGGEWSEDLLFIEPDSHCVARNLSIEWTVTDDSSSFDAPDEVGRAFGLKDLALVDYGGFVNINTTYPSYDIEISQTDPQLFERAYKGAWLANVYTALLFNVTNSKNSPNRTKAFEYMNSHFGKRFPLLEFYGADPDRLRGLYLTQNHLSYLDSNAFVKGLVYPNPEGIDRVETTSSISVLCRGAGGADIANITNILTACFEMRGAAHRVDGGHQGSSEVGSRWSSPLYTCVAGFKATIKTVTFRWQPPSSFLSATSSSPFFSDSESTTESSTETDDLSFLKVINIQPKAYASEDSYPVWGVENSGYLLKDVDPIWGIVSKAYESEPLISTVQQPSLYLPGYHGFASADSNNIPGAQFIEVVLESITDSFTSSVTKTSADYSGLASMSMLARWQKLANNTKTAGHILNLIWTDLAASAVTGSKGVLGHRNQDPANAVRIMVTPMRKVVKYHLPFATPAFILGVVVIAMTLAGIVTAFTTDGIKAVNLALRKSSTGRLMTMFMDPESSHLLQRPKDWNQMNGHKTLYLRAVPPSTADGGTLQGGQSAYGQYDGQDDEKVIR